MSHFNKQDPIRGGNSEQVRLQRCLQVDPTQTEIDNPDYAADHHIVIHLNDQAQICSNKQPQATASSRKQH